jgi:hypothetical protein
VAVIDQRNQRVEAQTNLVIQQVVPMLSPQDRDNRRRMLARVQGEVTQWLEESLGATAWIVLALEHRPEAVPDRWVEVTREHHRSDSIPSSVPTVADAFDALDGELLILGEPGAGKTTTLLDLARVLIERAEEDESFPMPVVFHLASWAARRAPLEEWLVGELTSPAYGVPLKLAQSWVDGDQILPLLDGLDEVAAEQRAACVAAINAFRARRTQRLARIVVCCRRAAYEALPRLELRGAICVQPLTEQQVDAYLADAGDRVAGLRTALQEDASLRELATTPLLLNLMVLAYHGESAATLLASGSPGERRGQLLTAYVQRMFTRRGARPPYPPERTIHWLACLARGLSDRSQTVFYLESLQQDWLQRLPIRHWFGPLTQVAVALPIGVAPALVVGLGGLVIFGHLIGQNFGWSLALSLAWQLRAWWYVWWQVAWSFVDDAVLLAVLLLGLPYALAYVVVTNLMSLRLRRSVAGEAGGWRNRLRLVATHRMVLGLGGGLAGGLLGGMVGGIACGLLITPTERTYGMAGPLMVGLVLGLIFGPTYGLAVGLLDVGSDRLAHFRVLRWSPRKALQSAWRGVVAGLATAVFMRYAVWTLTALISGQPGLWIGFDYYLEAISGLLGGAFGGLLGGITYRQIETRSTPNQGIRRAALRALLVGSVCGLFFGVIAGQGPARFGSEQAGPVAGQALGLFVGAGVGVAGGVASGMAHGGEACVAHLLIRLVLWWFGMLPLRSVRFLDYATERVLLRRVGGGYMFVHRLLQEHFAAHEQELVARLCRDGPTAQRRGSAAPAGPEAAPEAA